jgi:hypothetical protein
MKLLGIIENQHGIVIGAVTDTNPELMLAKEDHVERSQLRGVALTLATKYGVDPASFTLPAPKPAPSESDLTPQGAD